ncbi:MAG: aryl-sulfate sulfotransferase [Peptococcales bacterium]
MGKLQTARHGVTLWKRDKAYPGFTMFAPLISSRKQLIDGKTSRVYLIDMNGRIVHFWDVPGMVRMHAELLENGNILCGLKDVNLPSRHLTFSSHAILELDWDSNVVWKYDDDLLECHDRCRMRNGNTLIMKYEPLEPELQAKIKGGEPGTEAVDPLDNKVSITTEKKNGQIHTLKLEEITPEGEIVWSMKLSDALDPELDIIIPYGERELWPGLNAIEEMPDGNIIATSFNLSTIFIFDKQTKTVKWRFGNANGPGKTKLSFPHDPTVLDNGNILVFDNGRYFSSLPDGTKNILPPDFSRILEIDPSTNEVVWDYKEDNPVDFYSSFISSARRLQNGNTLICEGATGRFFEVTQRGEKVWEYVSPFYTRVNNRFGNTNNVFRCMRYDINYPGIKGKVFDDSKTDHINRLFGPNAYDV